MIAKYTISRFRKHFPCAVSENGKVSGMSATRTAKEGRVNVPLGKSKSDLGSVAKKNGTSESNLARVLILDGLARIKSGEMKFSGPSLSPTNSTGPEA